MKRIIKLLPPLLLIGVISLTSSCKSDDSTLPAPDPVQPTEPEPKPDTGKIKTYSFAKINIKETIAFTKDSNSKTEAPANLKDKLESLKVKQLTFEDKKVTISSEFFTNEHLVKIDQSSIVNYNFNKDNYKPLGYFNSDQTKFIVPTTLYELEAISVTDFYGVNSINYVYGNLDFEQLKHRFSSLEIIKGNVVVAELIYELEKTK